MCVCVHQMAITFKPLTVNYIDRPATGLLEKKYVSTSKVVSFESDFGESWSHEVAQLSRLCYSVS